MQILKYIIHDLFLCSIFTSLEADKCLHIAVYNLYVNTSSNKTCLSRYFAHGTATDFMYDVVRVPLAFTFEIYGDGTASSRDCFKMFNPTDLASYDTVLNDWSAAFFTIFKLAPHQLGEIQSKASVFKLDKLVSIDEYLDGYLMERRNRYGKKMEVLELGMQEIRTYYRLFLLSSVLLLCMFCSRISKTKSRPIVSAMSL